MAKTSSTSVPKPGPHPLAGRRVRLKPNRGHVLLDDATVRVEGRWLDVVGEPWEACTGDPACIQFRGRSAAMSIPRDDAGILYIKAKGLGTLIHESEIAEVLDAG